MANETTSFVDGATNEHLTLGEKISDAAGQMKDKVSDIGRTAVTKID